MSSTRQGTARFTLCTNLTHLLLHESTVILKSKTLSHLLLYGSSIELKSKTSWQSYLVVMFYGLKLLSPHICSQTMQCIRTLNHVVIVIVCFQYDRFVVDPAAAASVAGIRHEPRLLPPTAPAPARRRRPAPAAPAPPPPAQRRRLAPAPRGPALNITRRTRGCRPPAGAATGWRRAGAPPAAPAARGSTPAPRDLPSSTYQLNLSASCGTGGAVGGCLGFVQGLFSGC